MKESIHRDGSYTVSAIVSTYNSENYLHKCLRDLIDQTIYKRGALEIIIIDSGSEQNESSIAHDFISQYPHIVYQRTERETVYGAWNRGISIARGKYITNANTDDAHRHDALELMSDALEQNPAADLAYCNWRWTETPNDSFANPHFLQECHFPPYDPAIATLYCILGPHPMWRRTIFDRIGLFDASLRAVGDFDFQFRFIAAKCQAVLVPEVLSLFYVNKQGLSRNEDFSEIEVKLLHEKYHANIPIQSLFDIDVSDASATVDALISMGVMASRFVVPWEGNELSNLEYAVKCFHKALNFNPESVIALHNLIAALSKLKDWRECENLVSKYYHKVDALLKSFVREKYPLGIIAAPLPQPAINPIVYPKSEAVLSTRARFQITYGNGFYEDESGKRWAAPLAELTFNVSGPTGVYLHLICASNNPSFYDIFPFETVIATDDGLEQRFQFNSDNTSVDCYFNINVISSKCTIYFKSGASFIPVDHDPGNNDPRRLSVCLTNIILSPQSNNLYPQGPTYTENKDNKLPDVITRDEIAICTAVSQNYLAFARTFAQSVRRIHPEIRIFVLLVDRVGPNTFDPKQEPFELILLEDLDNIPNLAHFCFKYTPIELNTAAKPFVFEYIFKKFGFNKLVYFDPDILVLDSLQPIWDILDSNNLVLTPHITEPYPDSLHPSALSILQSGVYNLGFIGMSNTSVTKTFLKYWQDHLYNFCFMNVAKGMHVDQNWVDFAPCMFDGVKILKEPTYNVAYWNLHYTGSKINSINGKFFVGNVPLVFFHFSGFKLNNLEAISAHQTRYTLSSLPNLRPLFELYHSMLLNNNHAECLLWPYTYGTFDNGVRVSSLLRTIYEENFRFENFGNPFETSTQNCFINFLLRPIEGEEERPAPYISQLIAIIYNVRKDLPKLMPDALGTHREALFKWLNTFGIREYDLDLALIPGTPEFASLLGKQNNQQTSDRQSALDRVPTNTKELNYGINFIGYFKGEFGVADAARSFVNAANAVRIPYALNNLHAEVHSNNDSTYSEYADTNPYSINLFSVNADQALNVKNIKGPQFYEGHYNIASWFWELEKFPAKWQTSFQCYDEIWAASEFCCKSISAISPIPVYTVPLAIDFDMSTLSVDRFPFNLPAGQFVFLFVFDYLSVFERKNPLAVISAFRQAFEDSTNALMLIKTINSHNALDKSALLRTAADGINVRFIDQHYDGATMMSLMASVDCFVSLHRSEGFGLGLAQSMYLGKPVIATGYSGNMEFMNHRNSLLVDYKITELTEDYGPYQRGNVWADPSIDHASYLMQSVYNDRALVESLGRRATSDIKTYFSPRVIGEKMKSLIDKIESR